MKRYTKLTKIGFLPELFGNLTKLKYFLLDMR